MDVYFLEAAVPLTKTISATSKEPYPLVKNFTSHKEQINTPLELFKAIQSHSRKGHCLIKGALTRPLVKEPRAGTTRTDDMTEWMCLDFDRFETASIDDQLTAMGLSDVTYILQYSSSHNLPGTEGTISAHVFILLDEPVHAPTLKAWLMQQNLTLFRGELRLSRDMNQLSWPLDITTCQNDKLLYITTPKFVGIKDPVENRLQLITRPLPKLPVDRIGERHIDALKNDARAALNELRKAAGLKSRVAGTSWVGTVEVQNKPNAAQVTGIKDCGDFVRLNLNGGDSWAYWHRKDDFELIHDYKSDCWYKTKDLVPGYYSDLLTKRVEANATPNDEGDLILALRDLKTSRYFNGFWNPSTQNLRLYVAKNETQLDHWMKSNGRVLGDFIPVWEIEYDPRADYIVDEDNHRINTFIASEYMSVEPDDNQRWPTIRRIITHMLGAEQHKELVDHFLNWFAAVFQREHKPLTAWVCHGIEGCVAGDTIIYYNRGTRAGGRPLTIKEAYEKFSGTWKADGKTRKGKAWDRTLTTSARAVKDDMTVGFHEVMRIVESGEQQLYKLTDVEGNSIRVTAEHPFMRPDGSFTKLCDLKPGDVILRRGNKNEHVVNPKGRNKNRATVHSVQYHPYGWKHVINGKNYKRVHKARLVWEASMNGMEYDEFVNIIRNDEARAKTLCYLTPDIVVHHLDEDCSNDAIENLAIVDKLNHDAHHAKETGLGTVRAVEVRIASIVKDNIEMTYDMTMKAPYHNYEANGFIVSNTGKGYFINKIAKPILGTYNATSVTISNIEDQFNSWLEGKLLVLIDEVDVDDFKEKGRVSARLRNYITEPTIALRRMQTAAVEVQNYTSFIFSSNRPQPVFIPQSDRRYNVGNFQGVRLNPPDDAAVKSELEAFAQWLANHRVNIKQADTVLHTETREQMKALGVTSIEETARQILTGNLESLWLSRPDEKLLLESGVVNEHTLNAQAYCSLMRRLATEALKDPECRLSRDEIHTILQYNVGNIPRSPNKFTSLLRHNNIHTRRIRKDGQLTYGLEIRWKVPEWMAEELGERKIKLVKGRKSA